MIEIKSFTFNPFQENTYIVWNSEGTECAVIDPGCSNENEESELFLFIENNNLKPKYLLNTHCHIDHVLGNFAVKQKYQLPFYGPELDLPLLKNFTEKAQMFGLKIKESPPMDNYITEELTLDLAGEKMKFIFTPGHTPGEYCIFFEESKILISGDVLFNLGIGRTDLWGGDYNTLLNSIKEKLFTLEESVEVYPGHGNKTSIGYEKLNNPFF